MIKTTNRETWNGQSKQLLRVFLGDNEASFMISCSNFTFESFLTLCVVPPNNP